MPPDSNNSIKMEVGIEDCLHIEFEYNKSKYVDNRSFLSLLQTISFRHFITIAAQANPDMI
jgi:hypothetical protein